MTSDLLRVSEVADLLGQDEKTIRAKIKAGAIPAVRIGDGPRAPFRIPADEFEAWLYRAPPPAGDAAPERPLLVSGLEAEAVSDHNAIRMTAHA